MIYKPYCSSLPQPGAFLFKRPNLNHAFQRKKSHSIKPVLHFSPFKPTDNPQERQKKDQFPEEKKLAVRPLKSLTTLIKQPTESMVNLSINQKHSSNAFHNLSNKNLRTTFSPVPFARRERQLLDKSKDKAKQFDQKPTDQRLQSHRGGKLALKKEEKKCKQTPSFIKNKNNHSGPSIDDFRIVKTLRETEQYKENVVLHSKTHALFTLKSYKKAALRREKQLCEEIKFYLKNLQISHNLIVKCFGFFHDNDYLYLLEEFLQGETVWEYISQRKQPLNQQEIGPKVCEILTALTYLNSLQLSCGNLAQRNIMHAQNVCKLKRPYLVYQGKDLLFDIWCLGKLVYEMVTLCSLVEQHLLEEIHRVQELFSSKDIVLALEVGFKRFQGSSISRELVAFLVATLWEIQSEELTLQQIWQLDFVREYREEDIWPSPTSAAQ